MKLIERTRSAGGSSVLASIATLLLTTATGIMVARLLSVHDRGAFAAILGVNVILSQGIASGPAESQILGLRRNLNRRTVMSVAWLVGIVVGFVGAAILVPYSLTFANFSGEALAVIALLPLVGIIGALSMYLLLASQAFFKSAIIRVLQPALAVVFYFALFYFGYKDLTAVLVTTFLTGLISAAISVAYSRPRIARPSSWGRQDAHSTLKLIWHLGSIHALRIAGYRVDVILLASIAGGTSAGLYAVASSLTMAGNSLVLNLSPIMLTRGDNDARRFGQTSSALALVVSLGIAVAGPVLIPIFYGADYRPPPGLVPLLALALLLSSWVDTGFRVLQQHHLESSAKTYSALMLLFQIGFVSLGAIAGGLLGCAAGNIVAFLATLVLLYIATRRRLARSEWLTHRINPIPGFLSLARR